MKNTYSSDQLHQNLLDRGREIKAMCSLTTAISDSAIPWIVAHQAPLSMGFPRQEYWSGLPFPSPGDLPHPGIEPESPALAGGLLHCGQIHYR